MAERKEVALITGASSGIGADIARLLAAKKIDLIITARRKDRLESLRKELESTYGIKVEIIENDLSKLSGAKDLYDRVRSIRKDLTIVVNNAGFGQQSDVLDQSLDEIRQMIQVNITALTELTRLFGADFKAQNYGRFLQLSSIGAFQPAPIYAIYSAAKSYVLSFSYAMNHELKGTGVSITSLCPGITETEFHEVAGHKKTPMMEMSSMTSKKVAEIGVTSMFKRKALVTPGLMNKIVRTMSESVPRFMSTALAAASMKKQ